MAPSRNLPGAHSLLRESGLQIPSSSETHVHGTQYKYSHAAFVGFLGSCGPEGSTSAVAEVPKMHFPDIARAHTLTFPTSLNKTKASLSNIYLDYPRSGGYLDFIATRPRGGEVMEK
jgi:hypothetical protein